MQGDLLISVFLPIAMSVIMFGMGLSLVPDDFKRIAKTPKSFAIGISAQMLLLPLLALAVLFFFPMDPLLAVGLMILSFSPGGTVSNMFSFLSNGNIALSISLTAVVSVLSPFTIPIFAYYSMSYLLGEGQQLEMPIGKTILQLLVITVVPLAVGMLVNHWRPALSARLEQSFKIFSLVFLLAIIALILVQNRESSADYIAEVGLACLMLNILAMGSGVGLAHLFGLDRADSITISYEVGLQNGTTALFVTSTLLQNQIMSITPAVYGALMFVTGLLFGILVKLLWKPVGNEGKN